MKTKILMIAMVFSLAIVSCNKDNLLNSTITSDDVAETSKLVTAGDDVTNLIEGQLSTADGISGRGVLDLPSCANVSVTGLPATVGGTITKTIDFGNTGCTLNNGNTLKGKIIFSFPYLPNATSHTINCSFDNFYHNGIKIEGTKTLTRTLTSNGPVVNIAIDITATHPNGHVHHKVGTATRTMTAGYSTPLNPLDNVYSITGNWTNTSNSNTTSVNITSALIVKLNCNRIVQGVISYVKGSNNATLDYGNGDCDNQAVFTLNGVAHNITL